MRFSIIKISKRRFTKWLPHLSFSKFDFSVELVVLAIITTLLSLLLVQNIYASINDLGNYNILSKEKEELALAKKENEKLLKEKHYYESPYYARLYARESLNLVEQGQELYIVERKKEFDYEKNNDRMEKLDIGDYKKWWAKLIL